MNEEKQKVVVFRNKMCYNKKRAMAHSGKEKMLRRMYNIFAGCFSQDTSKISCIAYVSFSKTIFK